MSLNLCLLLKWTNWTNYHVGAIKGCTQVVNNHLRMKKWGERLKKVEQLAQSFQLNPLTSCYKPRLWPCQPSSVWKLFPRQSMAISFIRSCKEVTRLCWCWNISSVSTLDFFEAVYVWGENANICWLHSLDCTCFCTWKRKLTSGSKDLPGY